MALITIPATLGLGLVAKEFVLLTLGPKWLSAIAPLQILAVYASICSISSLAPQVLNVIGESRFVMLYSIYAILLMPGLFYLGSNWGTTGIAMGWILGYPLLLLPLYRRMFRTIRLAPKDYLGALWPALNGSILMALVVILLKWFLPQSLSVVIRLVLEVCLGFLSYAGSIALFHRETFQSVMQLVRNIRAWGSRAMSIDGGFFGP
jgi:PST family polysaccharide transporter